MLLEELTLDLGDITSAPPEPGREATTEPGLPESLPENTLVDYITGRPVPETPKEQVRQRVARALFHEYGIAVEDMARDFIVGVERDGRYRRRRVDIAVFAPGTGMQPSQENLRRVVVCQPEPKNGNTITKIRTPQQAEKDLAELRDLMGDERSPQTRYGMWTNGLELFFLAKTVERFGPKRTFRNRRVGMPASARILHGHQPYGLHLGPGWNLPAAGLLVCLI